MSSAHPHAHTSIASLRSEDAADDEPQMQLRSVLSRSREVRASSTGQVQGHGAASQTFATTDAPHGSRTKNEEDENSSSGDGLKKGADEAAENGVDEHGKEIQESSSETSLKPPPSPYSSGEGEDKDSSRAERGLQKGPEEAGENGVNGHGNENQEASSETSPKPPPSPYPSGEGEDEDSSRAEPGNEVRTVLQDTACKESGTAELRFCSLCDDTHTALAEGHCMDCNQDLCAVCINRHGKMSLAAHHNVVQFSRQEDNEGGAALPVTPSSQSLRLPFRSRTMDAVDRCRKHTEEKLRFFCKSCQQPVCRDCVLTSHKQHTTEDIGDATIAARTELSDMMGQLEQKKHLLESYLNVFEDYKANFRQNAQRVEEMVKSFYGEVKAAVDSSYREITKDLDQCQRNELERIRNQELVVHNNIEDVTRLLNKQPSTVDSSIFVLSQHEVVSHALKTLDENIQQMQLGQSEFFVSKNPRLAVIPNHFLGRVTFTTHIPPPEPAQKMQAETLIYEVKLHRELAFNIWEMSSSKSSVRSIVETSSGTLWVATPRHLLKVTSTVTRDSANVPDDIAGIAAGPGDKLLVSFGQGSTIKLYAGAGSWSGFASIPKSSSVIASRPHLCDRRLLHMYVAVTSQQGTTRILSYSTDGQVCQQHKLPPEIFHETVDSLDANANGNSAAAVAGKSSWTSASGCGGLWLSCMAVGADGSLCLGDVSGRRVLMVDWRGQLTGQYRGPDGEGGCQPRSVCVVRPGQVGGVCVCVCVRCVSVFV